MPTIPPYPPEGQRRCPICDMPFQTCTGHEFDPTYDTSPKYLIDVRRPKRVPAPIRGARTQAFQYPPHTKGAIMAEPKKPASDAAPVERTGGVPRTWPAQPADAPAEAPADAPADAPAEPPADDTSTSTRRRSSS